MCAPLPTPPVTQLNRKKTSMKAKYLICCPHLLIWWDELYCSQPPDIFEGAVMSSTSTGFHPGHQIQRFRNRWGTSGFTVELNGPSPRSDLCSVLQPDLHPGLKPKLHPDLNPDLTPDFVALWLCSLTSHWHRCHHTADALKSAASGSSFCSSLSALFLTPDPTAEEPHVEEAHCECQNMTLLQFGESFQAHFNKLKFLFPWCENQVLLPHMYRDVIWCSGIIVHMKTADKEQIMLQKWCETLL